MCKRIIAVNDISCVGKCSLTVALPIISAIGVECSVLPTALLSTHTGGFDNFTFTPLTEDMKNITAHWKALSLRADAVYSGYLGDPAQAEIAYDIIKYFGGVSIVDPVMADNGKLYSGFDARTVAAMRQLCSVADLVIPNITEANFLCEEEYCSTAVAGETLERTMKKLSELGPSRIIISGVEDGNGQIGAASYDASSGKFFYSFAKKYPGMYHGAGDVFGSAVAALTVLGRSAECCTESAVKFTSDVVGLTFASVPDTRYGPKFEPLLKDIKNYL